MHICSTLTVSTSHNLVLSTFFIIPQGSNKEVTDGHPHLTMQEVTNATRFKPKLKVRNTGSWRKEILGDITVINPEEVGTNKISNPAM